MRIKRLILRNFGPFRYYDIQFVEEEEACVLLTGKNNEGKTNIINALKFLSAATKVINKKKQEVFVDRFLYWRLLQQDTENILIGRMIHNYIEDVSEIQGEFTDGFSINVYLDSKRDIIYADYDGKIPKDVQDIFGFIPLLGLLNENEDIIQKLSYLKACLNTSLAPRHLRNHFFQILSHQEFSLVREIVNSSWPNIQLLKYELNLNQNKIYCYFKEGRIERELSWAGQGLQIWFQIITHLVRLRFTSVLILDEPEIYLHPEKQNDLIRIIKEHYNGSVIIATHSIELMNNVSVSHIIHVQKNQQQPKIKSTSDRSYLEFVRSQVGSNFNLIASQFEEFDIIIFTENSSDFSILIKLAENYNILKKAFNIPIHGFSEYKKAIFYKHAYELLIGGKIAYTMLLDRDYYPKIYLAKVKKELKQHDIRTIFTIGKEIENLFLSSMLIRKLIPRQSLKRFEKFWDRVFQSERLDCYSSYLTLHKQFLDPKIDTKSVTKKYTPLFEKRWNDKKNRFKVIAGKIALQKLRGFYREEFNKNLTQKVLIKQLVATDDGNIKQFIEEIYHINKPTE